MTPEERKERPMATGVLDYFPDALMEVANCSFIGNEQHNPGQPLHWAKGKSTDHADALLRHLKDRGTYDTDGVRHSAKVAWRALALLQTEMEAAQEQPAKTRFPFTVKCIDDWGTGILGTNVEYTVTAEDDGCYRLREKPGLYSKTRFVLV